MTSSIFNIRNIESARHAKMYVKTPAHESSISFAEAVAVKNLSSPYGYDKTITKLFNGLHKVQTINSELDLTVYIDRISSMLFSSSTHLNLADTLYNFVLTELYPKVYNKHDFTKHLAELLSEETSTNVHAQVNEMYVRQLSAWQKALKEINVFETKISAFNVSRLDADKVASELDEAYRKNKNVEKAERRAAKVAEEALTFESLLSSKLEAEKRFAAVKDRMNELILLETVTRPLNKLVDGNRLSLENVLAATISIAKWYPEFFEFIVDFAEELI